MKLEQKIQRSIESGRDSVAGKLQFRPVTLERFESVCLLIGLDPDDVRHGEQDVRVADAKEPYTTGPRLLGIMLRNASQYDLVLFEKPAAEEFIAVVIADFFFSCLKHFERQKLGVRTTLKGPASTPSETILRKARHSRASSPA